MNSVWTRRKFVGALGAGAAGVLLPPIRLASAAAWASSTGFAGTRAVRAAMHVHGSWSEGRGSWEAQFQQAASNGYDLLFLTDHDMSAMALDYLTSLSGVTMLTSSTGSLAQQEATASSGALRLLAESSSTTQPATVTLAVSAGDAKNRLRTSISGFTIQHAVTSATLTNGAQYDIVVPLSYHPAVGGRPGGQYKIVYRFGGKAARLANGITGIVRAPTPAAGSVQTLSPETDAAALWPDMLAIDNAVYGLSFLARSPRSTAVADLRIASVSFGRSRSNAASVIADQAQVIETYQPQHPGLTARASTEISKAAPHMNPFGIPPWLPDYSTLSTGRDTRYRQMVAQVHGMGGVISWNHPLGYGDGPLLSATEREAKRRRVFSSMQAVDVFGVDIIEVGYNQGGQVDAATHLALWDTFSRTGRFLTGNGTSDDHGGQNWPNLNNGYATGLWAPSAGDADVVAALTAGRAFTVHAGRWPGGEIDLLVDSTVPMGGVSVSTHTSRELAIAATALPTGSSVQVVAGPVDYAGRTDPETAVITTLQASAFTAGPATVQVDTTASRFYRAQVLDSAGQILGSGNPVWLLREQPPVPIPAARQH